MWTEKYRPRNLDTIFGQESILERLKVFVQSGADMPHFLFAGPPGVGKTSSALALGRAVFGNKLQESLKELNASDERGIDVVRKNIKQFARMAPASGTKFRMIILDEADSMTNDAQQALRRTMEKYKGARFILIANYSSRIIEPIQSRCVVFRFRPVPIKKLKERLLEISKKEKVPIDEEGLNAIVEISAGDMRKMINLLQATCALTDEKKTIVNASMVYEVAGRVEKQQLEEFLTLIIEKRDFRIARENLRNLLYNYGLSGKDFLFQLHSAIIDAKLSNNIKTKILEEIGETDYFITVGSNEEVQISALLAKMIIIVANNN